MPWVLLERYLLLFNSVNCYILLYNVFRGLHVDICNIIEWLCSWDMWFYDLQLPRICIVFVNNSTLLEVSLVYAPSSDTWEIANSLHVDPWLLALLLNSFLHIWLFCGLLILKWSMTGMAWWFMMAFQSVALILNACLCCLGTAMCMTTMAKVHYS